MPDDRPTAAEIRELLATLLAGAAGGSKASWASAIGAIMVHPTSRRPRCNWEVKPQGSTDQQHAIERAVEIVAAEHPYARGAS